MFVENISSTIALCILKKDGLWSPAFTAVEMSIRVHGSGERRRVGEENSKEELWLWVWGVLRCEMAALTCVPWCCWRHYRRHRGEATSSSSASEWVETSFFQHSPQVIRWRKRGIKGEGGLYS